MDGVLNVIKPKDWTSFDVIAKLQRIYHQKKIGHGGTLDPMASGVLPVFLGRATRLIEYAPIHTKRYEAEFIMGIRTDTEDMTGEILERGEVPSDTSIWEGAVSAFRGDIMQVPSIYSAIKVNGERAYKLAREGKEVELKARPVTIYDLTIWEIAPPVIKLHVTCSSGTYIRALGRDIGEKAGCLLTMSSLVRTVVGPFSIENAKTMEEIEKDPEGSLMTSLKPILSGLPNIELSEKEARDFLQGKRLKTKKKTLIWRLPSMGTRSSAPHTSRQASFIQRKFFREEL